MAWIWASWTHLVNFSVTLIKSSQWEPQKREVSNSNNTSSCLELTSQCGIINRSVNWKLGEIF